MVGHTEEPILGLWGDFGGVLVGHMAGHAEQQILGLWRILAGF